VKQNYNSYNDVLEMPVAYYNLNRTLTHVLKIMFLANAQSSTLTPHPSITSTVATAMATTMSMTSANQERPLG